MEYNLDLNEMVKFVSAELKEWKVLMEDLAGAFYNRFPATKKYGWTLHLDRCTASKGCDMCPHSIYWVRYYWVVLKDETKSALKQSGKTAPNSKMSWDNTKSGKSRDKLPSKMRLTKDDRQIHKEFEAARAEIMHQHKTFSRLRKKLLARIRNAGNDLSLPLNYFADPVLREYYMAVLPLKPIKIAIIRKIQELRKV